MPGLKMIESDQEKRKQNARNMMIELADAGYDHVTVIGFKENKFHITSSQTDDILRDMGAHMAAVLRIWERT